MVPFKEQYNITAAILAGGENKRFHGTIIIDCITLWLNNIITEKNDEIILKEVKILLSEMKKAKAAFIIVSNEVGLGIVPPSELG